MRKKQNLNSYSVYKQQTYNWTADEWNVLSFILHPVFYTNFSEVFFSVPSAQHHSASSSINASLVQNIKHHAHYPGFQRLLFFLNLIPNSLRDSELQRATILRERALSTVSTVYFILGILRMDLWNGQNIYSPNRRVLNSEEFESREGRLPHP